MAKFVMLTPARYGKYAIVDDEDFDRVMERRWSYNVGTGYVLTRNDSRTLPLANFVLNIPPGTIVDHIDRNPLNNCKSNLRMATQSQNIANSIRHWRAKSGYRGVQKAGNNYRAHIAFNNKVICLGTYATPQEAARVRDKAARELHGEFAVLNFPDEDGVL
jgi:hypothetical protein